MLIQSVRVEGFRGFREKMTLYPAYSEEKRVTLIQSSDSDSVETLYQACRWCLYGCAQFDSSDFLLNNDLADSLIHDEEQRVQVEMILSHRDAEYLVLRTQGYRGRGDLIQSEDRSTVTVSLQNAGGAWQALPTVVANQFLEDLRHNRSICISRGTDYLERGLRDTERQTLLFATRAELKDLDDRVSEDDVRRGRKKDLYRHISKIYHIRKCVRYGIEPLWEDAAIPARNVLRDLEKLPRFSLPGRPALETLFNDHVVDIVRARSKYCRLGVDFPGAIILHGAPGSGKTYAVERLGEFLGWPRYYIDNATVGGTYIHETGMKINRVFEQAASNAPSIVVIDEMDAFLSFRRFNPQDSACHNEEISEFLRLIPNAAKNHVLVIGMTNRLDDLDPAFLRRGRFDHIVEVEMPTREEMEAALAARLSKLPTAEDVELPPLVAALAGRPMSDLAFVVKEAGRLSVRGEKDAIDQAALRAAIRNLPPLQRACKKVGFTA